MRIMRSRYDGPRLLATVLFFAVSFSLAGRFSGSVSALRVGSLVGSFAQLRLRTFWILVYAFATRMKSQGKGGVGRVGLGREII